MTSREQLDVMIETDPAAAQLAMIKHIFIATAEITAQLDAITPVIGAIAGRLGISASQIRKLTERSSSHDAGSHRSRSELADRYRGHA